MIIARNISKKFGNLQVLNNVSLEINKAEIVTIVGPSGAGKSTLLHLLGTLEKSDTGTIAINGTELHSMKEKELAEFRNKNIGFVFQFHHLLPEFTAIENVCIPAFISKSDKEESYQRAKSLMENLGLSQRLNHKPSELSGGEQQRVAIARALMNNPSVIFADEPSGNLDSENAKDLHNLFFRLREDFKQTFVIVTHNEALAGMADRKIIMKDGDLVSQQ